MIPLFLRLSLWDRFVIGCFGGLMAFGVYMACVICMGIR